MNRKIKGNLILLITAVIWGSSFVSQSVGMDFIGPNTFNGIRTLLGGMVLLPVIFFMNRKKSDNNKIYENKKVLVIGGIVCGLLLCAAGTVQTLGLRYTTAAKSGFITAMYIIFVPFFGLFLKKKVGILTYVGAAIALAGLYLLCMSGAEFEINFGDVLTLICAFIFSFHILAVDYFADKTDGVKLSCIQFFVCGTVNIILMFIFEKPDFSVIKDCWFPICYSGIFSCGVAYTLQIVGQKYTDPTPAAIIMSLESVFAAITGFIILNERMGFYEILGCVIMFAAIIIVQLPDDILKKCFHTGQTE